MSLKKANEIASYYDKRLKEKQEKKAPTTYSEHEDEEEMVEGECEDSPEVSRKKDDKNKQKNSPTMEKKPKGKMK